MTNDYKIFYIPFKGKNTCHTNCHQLNCDLSKLFHLLFLLSSFDIEQNEGEDWFRSSWRRLRRRVSGCCRSTISTITLWIIMLASILYIYSFSCKTYNNIWFVNQKRKLQGKGNDFLSRKTLSISVGSDQLIIIYAYQREMW